MISRIGLVTANDLLAMKNDGFRYELVDGELRKMSPAGGEHGQIAGRILRRLGDHVEEHNLGQTYAAETGFRIASDPDTVRAPDVAFLSHDSLRTIERIEGYLPIAPDLLVEVVSPSDTFSEVESKAASWIDAGTKIVIVADPRTRTLRVYRGSRSIEVLHEGDTLDAGNVVPNWSLAVSDALLLN